MHKSLSGVPWVVVLVFGVAGVLHFVAPGAYERIMPRWLPGTGAFGPRPLVLLSGACEILGALGVLYAPTRAAAGWGLILLLVAVFPANVEMLVAAHERHASGWAQALLVARLPMQPLMIWWVWLATVRP